MRNLTEREMADEQKPDPSLLKLAIQRECKVASPKNESTKILSRTPSFSDWTDNGSFSQTSLQGFSSWKVPTSEYPCPPNSSPRPQNQMGQSSIKNEPWQCSNELPNPGNLASACKDWIGSIKLSNDKFQTHGSSYEMTSMVPFSSEKSQLNWRTPAKFPSTNMFQSGLQLLKLRPNTMGIPNQIKLLPKPSIPTRPRSGLKRKACHNEQVQPHQNPSPSTSNMIKKSVESLFCELCQVSCSSALTMQQHLKGRPHKAKLGWRQLKRNCTGERKGKPRCDICQIWCSDRNALEMHFKGQKHKTKLQELELCKQIGGENIRKKPILCELCHVPCMNEDLYKMHLKGRQHTTREGLKRRGLL